MTASGTHTSLAELIDAFADAPPQHLVSAYHRLVDAVWRDGELTDLAPRAVAPLVQLLDRVDKVRKGYVAVLLGLLAEAEYPATDGPVTAVIRRKVDYYLSLLALTPAGQPLALAALYLVAHLPGDRERILARLERLAADADDLSRVDRALQPLDPRDPVLGRVFPSPSAWTLDETEREFDRSWIRTLTAEQVERAWQDDTRTVLGHLGAKAYWAVRHGAPVPARPDEVPARRLAPQQSPDGGAGLFTPHAETFRCPACGARLAFLAKAAQCTGCGMRYRVLDGILDLTAPEQAAGAGPDLQFKLAQMPTMGYFYEAHARPNFLRFAGSNWGGTVRLSDEDGYLATHVNPVDGPVLDLAAGAGRWTSVLAGIVGAERLIALDLNPPMLTALRARVPEVPAVMASARTLPFADASLGAVVCWNALQAFPGDAAAAIAEVGRCLRPGGTFTLMTFRASADPVYRYFQSAHRFPQHTGGLRLFEPDDVKGWLAAARLSIVQEWTPGTFMFITAQREGRQQ
jgi:SAM-dependent methyltransferase